MIQERLSRRRFLRGSARGAAVALALPTLDLMLDGNGVAFADGTPIPRRFCFWFFGNGFSVGQDRNTELGWWVPKKTGAAWWDGGAPELLAPFVEAGVADYVSVASGLGVRLNGTKWNAHNTGHWAMVTAAFVQPGEYPDPDGPTLAEAIAGSWAGSAPVGRIECGISQNRTWGGVNYVESFGEMSPRSLFDKLFPSGAAAPDPRQKMLRDAARKTLVDAVAQDARSLQARLGSRDKARVDQYLQSVHDLDRRLGAAVSSCQAPVRPAADTPYDPLKEDLDGRNRDVSDIVRLAFACDRSRVAHIQYSRMQANTVYWMLGSNGGQHDDVTHAEGSAAQLMHKKQVRYTMEKLAAFIKGMKDIQVGSGNLLDHSCIMACSEQGLGHDTSETIAPLIIGKAGGRLKGGVHYASTAHENATKAHLTCIRALDVNLASFGKGENQETNGLTALLV